MSREAVSQLMDRWINEPQFRKEIRSNPEAVVHKAGVELSAEEWTALRKIYWSLSDEELKSWLERPNLRSHCMVWPG